MLSDAAGVSTAFGALLIDTTSGSWKLVDAANTTVVRGDTPVLDHAFAQGRVDLAVHGTAGPPADQVGPFNHQNNPCLSNGERLLCTADISCESCSRYYDPYPAPPTQLTGKQKH